MTTSTALRWVWMMAIALVTMFLIIQGGFKAAYQQGFNKGVESTQSLNQKEGEIWVNEELKKREQNQAKNQ